MIEHMAELSYQLFHRRWGGVYMWELMKQDQSMKQAFQRQRQLPPGVILLDRTRRTAETPDTMVYPP